MFIHFQFPLTLVVNRKLSKFQKFRVLQIFVESRIVRQLSPDAENFVRIVVQVFHVERVRFKSAKSFELFERAVTWRGNDDGQSSRHQNFLETVQLEI